MKEKSNYPKVPSAYKVEYVGSSKNQNNQKKTFKVIKVRHSYWKKIIIFGGLFFVIGYIFYTGKFGTENNIVPIEPVAPVSVISEDETDTNVVRLVEPEIVVSEDKSEVNYLQLEESEPVLLENAPNAHLLQLVEPKTVIFEWEYKNVVHRITEVLYKTAYQYYKSEPKEYTCIEGYCPDNWEEYYLKMFLNQAENDDIISQIALSIKATGQKIGLNDDQVVELAIAFIQSIPYDHAKVATGILSPRYPYEVLYDNKGICSGKSFLTVLLLKELGYGVALFEFDYAEHIAPAIKCPKEYSSYNSGYCFAEVTTEGFRIGELPDMSADAKLPKARVAISLFAEDDEFKLGNSKLEEVEIYKIADGNSYKGIIQTTQVLARIEFLENELNILDKVLSIIQEEVEQLENNVTYYEEEAQIAYKKYEILKGDILYNQYMELYTQYESAYTIYESKLDEYEVERVKYDNYVNEYNSLLVNF